MRHLSEAKEAVERVLLEERFVSQADKLCAIWDLQGRLRLLVQPKSGVDVEQLKGDLTAAVGSEAGVYWSEEYWIWSSNVRGPEKAVYELAWREAKQTDSPTPTVRILNRHVSKQAWFSNRPVQPPWPLSEKTPPIASFFSFKGGVGRTTALASTAVQLARVRKRVCVIDLDLEAPGAGMLFLPTRGGAQYGVVDYLLERPLHKDPEFDINDYIYSCDDPKVIGTEGAPIAVVPAGVLNSDYLEKLARIDFQRLQPDGDDDPLLVRLLRDLRRAVTPDYVLIDARAGLHDIGGLALNGLAHLDIVFGLDSDQSWAGLELVVRYLGKRLIESGQKQLDCGLVFAMAPGPTAGDREEREKAFLANAYDLFSDAYYDAEDHPDGEWPLPALDAEDQPHFPIAIGFSEDVKRATSLPVVADLLTQAEFQKFLSWLLARLGRGEP